MTTPEREAIERDVRARCDEGDYAAAATRAVQGYGAEVFGFLLSLQEREEDASDVFSAVCESLWRSLPSFAWACTLRTWLYTIARNASVRHRKDEKRRARGAIPMSEQASRLVAVARTETKPFLQTAHKDRLRQLRDSLPEEDRTLLVLRVDRDLAWNELARVMLGEADEPDAQALSREAARLRKRFQLVKEKLVEIGRREGLLPKPGEGDE